ncbi:hypothetical protein [Dyadobacter aurulentus]|uniref:hypothetical protein n=1 Tax=Dyadobacter sp. UC 10 TaxID=2605428 RepID=UPI0011F2CBE1|nr:hypothetical protein [Dyadobacter sp. UC 10]KAA0990154.1 hypothetical protein FXO21_08275 [Dyadobacter sp. UC 10]
MVRTKFIPIILLAVALFGCNKLIEVNPDTNTAPEQAVALIRSRFPAASDLVFNTLVKGRVWDASFKVSNSRYRSAVDRTSILTTSRSASESLHDSLVILTNHLFIRWGTISNIREILPDSETGAKKSSYFADYAWKGNLWTLKVTFAEPGSPFYHTVTIIPRIDLEYVTADLESLPAKAQEVLKERGQWSGAVTVRIDKDGKRTYLAPFYRFDDDGIPFFTGLNNVVKYGNMEEIAPGIHDYFKHSSGFSELSFSSGTMFDDGSCAGYSLYLGNDNEKVSEQFHFIFSRQGYIVTESYTASVKP